MNRLDMEKHFMQGAAEDLDAALEDLVQLTDKVAKSKAIYKGKPIPFLYMPRFLDGQDLDTFQNAVYHMMAICQKMIKLYRSVPAIRKLYGFDARLEALILKDSPYQCAVPMARFDIFYYGPGDFKFCELNTDGTSAMNEDRELANVFSSNQLLERTTEAINLNSFELFDTWVNEVGQLYRESHGTKSHPRVAIVDLFEKASSIEFEVFKERFEALGFPCVIADARKLEYTDALYFEGQCIDIVYRRLVTKDMMEHIDMLPAFEKACHDDKTLIIGNVQSQVVHTKKFFQLLHDDRVRPYFNQEELAFIDRHVPITDAIAMVAYQMDSYVSEKDKWLIKPLDYYASIGVYAGRDYTEEQWAQLLKDHINKPYLIQQFCQPPQFENYALEQNQLTRGYYNHITGLFVYNGKFYGVYSRAGRTSIISGLHDVFTLPSLFIGDFKV